MFRLVDEADVRGSWSASLDGRGDGGGVGACSFVGDALEVIGRVRVGETVSLAPDAEYLVRIDQPAWPVEMDANEDAKRDAGRVGLKASSSVEARDDPLSLDQGRSEGAKILVGGGGQQDCAGDVCAERVAEGGSRAGGLDRRRQSGKERDEQVKRQVGWLGLRRDVRVRGGRLRGRRVQRTCGT